MPEGTDKLNVNDVDGRDTSKLILQAFINLANEFASASQTFKVVQEAIDNIEKYMNKTVELNATDLASHKESMAKILSNISGIAEKLEHISASVENIDEMAKINQAVVNEKEKSDQKVGKANEEAITQLEKQLDDKNVSIKKLEKQSRWMLGILLFVIGSIILTLAAMAGVNLMYPDLTIFVP